MMPHMQGWLKNLISKGSGCLLPGFYLVFISGCFHKGVQKPSPKLAPYEIKKVSKEAISLPTLIIQSDYGREEVHPAVWNAKTLKFSEGMPQKIKVQKGDSLYALSKKYAVPLPLIIAQNQLLPPFVIRPGQTLTLMGPRVHIVQNEQNLYEISMLHNVSMSALVRQNRLSTTEPLHKGQQLILPAENSVVKKKSLPLSGPSSTSFSEKGDLSSTLTEKLSEMSSRLLKFSWPLKGKVISKFGLKDKDLYNDGINIAASKGAPVLAAEGGVVVYSGSDIKSYGNLVLLKHTKGWMTGYAHLGKVSVRKGTSLKKGDTLGSVGISGFVNTPQLHFEIRRNGKPVNPLFHLPG